MGWKTLDQMELEGKRVLTRVDLNVPIKDEKISDDTRIKKIIPTLSHIIKRGGLPILVTHLGRPNGQRNPHLSFAKISADIEKLINRVKKTVNDKTGVNLELEIKIIGE